MNKEEYPIAHADLEVIIGHLMTRMALEPQKLYYIDIYPLDPAAQPPEYTYELSEQPHGNEAV